MWWAWRSEARLGWRLASGGGRRVSARLFFALERQGGRVRTYGCLGLCVEGRGGLEGGCEVGRASSSAAREAAGGSPPPAAGDSSSKIKPRQLGQSPGGGRPDDPPGHSTSPTRRRSCDQRGRRRRAIALTLARPVLALVALRAPFLPPHRTCTSPLPRPPNRRSAMSPAAAPLSRLSPDQLVQLQGQVVWLSGAASGIGKELALMLSQAGCVWRDSGRRFRRRRLRR